MENPNAEALTSKRIWELFYNRFADFGAYENGRITFCLRISPEEIKRAKAWVESEFFEGFDIEVEELKSTITRIGLGALLKSITINDQGILEKIELASGAYFEYESGPCVLEAKGNGQMLSAEEFMIVCIIIYEWLTSVTLLGGEAIGGQNP